MRCASHHHSPILIHLWNAFATRKEDSSGRKPFEEPLSLQRILSVQRAFANALDRSS